MQNNYPKKKALLAIAFAGGILNSQLPTFADESADSSSTVSKQESSVSNLQEMAEAPLVIPEIRAYYLLRLAQNYLSGSDSQELVKNFKASMNSQDGMGFHCAFSNQAFAAFAREVSSRSTLAAKTTAPQGIHASELKSQEKSNFSLADSAIAAALGQTEQFKNKFMGLYVCFIASLLYERTGNVDGIKQCNDIIEEASQNSTDEQQIKAAYSILADRAYFVLPVIIPETKSDPQPQVKPFTVNELDESEKFKLRALAVVDRLKASEHERRKAHRDMVLWYRQVGNADEAEKEKQILFKLVGSEDDRLIWPMPGTCGQLLWWTADSSKLIQVACGMG